MTTGFKMPAAATTPLAVPMPTTPAKTLPTKASYASPVFSPDAESQDDQAKPSFSSTPPRKTSPSLEAAFDAAASDSEAKAALRVVYRPTKQHQVESPSSVLSFEDDDDLGEADLSLEGTSVFLHAAADSEDQAAATTELDLSGDDPYALAVQIGRLFGDDTEQAEEATGGYVAFATVDVFAQMAEFDAAAFAASSVAAELADVAKGSFQYRPLAAAAMLRTMRCVYSPGDVVGEPSGRGTELGPLPVVASVLEDFAKDAEALAPDELPSGLTMATRALGECTRLLVELHLSAQCAADPMPTDDLTPLGVHTEEILTALLAALVALADGDRHPTDGVFETVEAVAQLELGSEASFGATLAVLGNVTLQGAEGDVLEQEPGWQGGPAAVQPTRMAYLPWELFDESPLVRAAVWLMETATRSTSASVRLESVVLLNWFSKYSAALPETELAALTFIERVANDQLEL